MKKRVNRDSSGNFPWGKLFFAGFILGVLIPNVIWKLQWHEKTAASLYLLENFTGRMTEGRDYLLYVTQFRGGYFLIPALCGISVFGVPLAVTGMLLCGLEIGMMLTLSILQFGLPGGFLGVGLLFPQYLLYLPALVFLFAAVYGESMEIWNNRGLLHERMYQYGIQIVLAGMLYAGGIFLEVYANPWVLDKLIKNLEIF